MRPRWRRHAGYARTSGGVLVRTPEGESWIGGRHAYRLVRELVPHLDGRSTAAQLVRHLDQEQARAVSELLAHLSGIGAIEDVDAPAVEAPPPEPWLGPAVPAMRGDGALYDAMLAELPVAPQRSGPVVVTVHDAPDRRRDRRLRASLTVHGQMWLPVRVDVNEVWIGPLSGAWPGCPTCLDLRRRAAHSFGHARERIARNLARSGSPFLRAGSTARAVLGQVAGWDTGDRRIATRLPLAGGQPEPVVVLPVPGCPVCGSPGTGRCLDTGGEEEGLEVVAARLARFVPDRRAGIVCGVVCKPDESLPGVPLARAWAPMQDLVRGRSLVTEWAVGSGDTVQESRTIAVLEALERYAGSRPRGQAVEWASADELGGEALDPRLLVLHSEEQYGRPGFPCAPFDPRTPRWWVRAHSVREDRLLAVPAELVFYGRWMADGVPPLAYNTSSGCAVGGSASGAALRALLEVLERDALLVAWYARRPLRQLDLAAARDPRIAHLVGALAGAGYACVALDVTLPDVGVPVVWTVAVNTGGEGLHAISGACADPVWERALLGAVREAASHLVLTRAHHGSQRRRARRLAADPRLVRTPIDHALLYGEPSAFGRIEALFGPRSPVPLCERAAPDGLDAICARLIASGRDVLIADITPADVRELGLTVARALVPGAIPITFGHGHERLTGATRVPPSADTRWPHPLA